MFYRPHIGANRKRTLIGILFLDRRFICGGSFFLLYVSRLHSPRL